MVKLPNHSNKALCGSRLRSHRNPTRENLSATHENEIKSSYVQTPSPESPRPYKPPQIRKRQRHPSPKTFLTAHGPTHVAAFNVHTLTSDAKLATLAKVASDYKIDILALTEVRRTGQGVKRVSHPEIDHDYYLLHSGHKERREHGVGLLVSSHAFKSLADDWSPISPRLLRARFRSRHSRLTVIVAYAPTLPSPEEKYIKFYPPSILS